MPHPRLLAAVLALPVALAGTAGESAPLSDQAILAKVTAPSGFTATVFASPPVVTYPVYVSAALDGTLFVGCDQNGSLDRKPGRGRILRLRDADGDGKAEQVTTFATVDSPRGLGWDASTGTLYVMHPPDLTAYRDQDGDGVAESQVDLVKGLGFGLDFRGADHTTNGLRLAIDGWIYIAVGDYGAAKATGTDGRTLSLLGGGVVRVRPDGSGLELVVSGTRNLLAVAISPTLDLFSRDNTNDGDGWNVRLSHLPAGAQMGYPSLYQHFADEMIPAMVDYGGGSPVGALWLDEPASLPAAWARGFYSVEWGRSQIALHPLSADGATWKAGSTTFAQLPKPTDMDVDADGRLYVASWDGGGYTYKDPHVGYVVRLAPTPGAAPAIPDLKKASDAQLVALIGAPSAVRRQAAQRELLLRGAGPAVAKGLEALVTPDADPGVRVAAMFTLKLLSGVEAHPALLRFAMDAALRETALKALADDPRVAAQVAAKPFIDALRDADPRVRLQAATGLWRLGKLEAAAQLLPLTADRDYTVAHVAVQALAGLKASAACLAAVDGPDATLHRGALRALQTMYDPAVVEALIARLASAPPAVRPGIFRALCRLHFRETPFTDPKTWWGTRPDTSGPIFKPEAWAASGAIQAALKGALEQAQGEDARAFIVALMRHKIAFSGFTELMLAKAGADTASRLEVLQTLVSPKAATPVDVLKAVAMIATAAGEKPELRARAYRLLATNPDKDAETVAPAFATLVGAADLAAVWEDVTRDPRLAKRAGLFGKLARDRDPAVRTLGATVLVNIVTSAVGTDAKLKDAAGKEIAGLWADAGQAVSVLGAIGATRAAAFAAQVRERLAASDPAVAAAAQAALAKLGLAGADAAADAADELSIADLSYEDAAKSALAAKGDAVLGRQLFLQQGCVLCHTMDAKEPPKGPMLGGISARYSRAELIESILKPGAKIAQGFESQAFTLAKVTVEGFVIREGGDALDVRSIAGVTTTLEKKDIVKREKREQSMMPEGLVGRLTPTELAGLLAYLESTLGTGSPAGTP